MPASSIVTLSKIVAERRCIDNEYVFSHVAISSGVIHLEKSLAPIASLILVRFELDLALMHLPRPTCEAVETGRRFVGPRLFIPPSLQKAQKGI